MLPFWRYFENCESQISIPYIIKLTHSIIKNLGPENYKNNQLIWNELTKNDNYGVPCSWKKDDFEKAIEQCSIIKAQNRLSCESRKACFQNLPGNCPLVAVKKLELRFNRFYQKLKTIGYDVANYPIKIQIKITHIIMNHTFDGIVSDIFKF